MVDTAHDSFPMNTGCEESENSIKWTKNIDGTDFHLMECSMKGNQ